MQIWSDRGRPLEPLLPLSIESQRAGNSAKCRVAKEGQKSRGREFLTQEDAKARTESKAATATGATTTVAAEAAAAAATANRRPLVSGLPDPQDHLEHVLGQLRQRVGERPRRKKVRAAAATELQANVPQARGLVRVPHAFPVPGDHQRARRGDGSGGPHCDQEAYPERRAAAQAATFPALHPVRRAEPAALRAPRQGSPAQRRGRDLRRGRRPGGQEKRQQEEVWDKPKIRGEGELLPPHVLSIPSTVLYRVHQIN